MNKLKLPLFLALVAFPASASAAVDADVPAESTSGDEVADVESSEEPAVEEALEDDDDDDGFELPFDVSVSTSLSTSAGNLRPGVSPNETADSLLNSWGFGVGREIVDGFDASIDWGFYKYLTRYGGLNSQREARINDISVGLSFGPIVVIPRADIAISGSLSGVVPVSRISRTQTLRTAISPGLSFSRSFGNLRLGATLGATKYFHEFTSPVIEIGREDIDAFVRDGGAESISASEVAVAGVNSEWSWSSGLSMSYEWIDGLTTGLRWGYGRSWAYDVGGCDEFSSENARCDRLSRDSMTGAITVAYAFKDHYRVSLGATTAQTPKTADGRRVNFPFWDLQTSGVTRTTLSLGFSFDY